MGVLTLGRIAALNPGHRTFNIGDENAGGHCEAARGTPDCPENRVRTLLYAERPGQAGRGARQNMG